LKKVLVDSWEIITQCKSVPDLPAPITIKDALNKYLQSKGIDTLGSSHDEEPAAQGVLLACDDTDKQAWIDTRDGLCQCFDEALPSRILYAEELPQLYAMDSNDNVDAENTYSEVYGCEHLLRLFTRLPELLLSSMSEAEARPIFAKINDFIRFLHKDNSLFSLNYRPYNDDELKQVRKIEKIEQKKRKRQSEVDKTVVIN
jgi:mortality factor 4-like protein 1